MSPVRHAQGLVARLREEIRWFDLLVTIFANMSAAAILAGILWFLFSGAALERVTGVLQKELEISEIKTLAEANASRIETMSIMLDANAQILQSAFPSRPAIIDTDLSRVGEECYVGEECTAFFFVRRDPRYLHCGAPAVIRHAILDFDGTEHSANPGPRNKSQQRGPNLTKVPVGFIPAYGTPPGQSFYFMVLRYDCGTETIEQQTKPMPFMLRPQRTHHP